MVLWHMWIGRARHLGPGIGSLAVEVFNVGTSHTLGIWFWRLKWILWLWWSTG